MIELVSRELLGKSQKIDQKKRLDFTGDFPEKPEKSQRKREEKTVKIPRKALIKSMTQ